MKTIITVTLIMAFICATALSDETTPPPAPTQEEPEILTRGPVNEAFAEPVDLENEEGIIATKAPPAPIVENPPDRRPAGDQFVWIPGYWAWDTDRKDYIWVSGCWRAAPPGMSWVPGYWAAVPGGWQWVSGFWKPVASGEIEYLPAPPALVSVEPIVVAPAPDRIWVPPCWYWRNGRYVLRSGYWLVGYPDWIWIPSHYVWTPRGYVFIRGYWDYAIHRRGILFAPVHFPRPVYVRPGFALSLNVVVDTGAFRFGLFTFPRYRHYFFGDYYDDFYISIGIFPRYECERHHRWYDPIYYHDKWRHHKDRPRWFDFEKNEYDRRRADKDLRPPRTYRELETHLAKMPEEKRKEIRIAEPINTVFREKHPGFNFERVNQLTRQRINKEVTEVGKYREERSRWEASKPQKPQLQEPTVRIKERPQEKPQPQERPQLQEETQPQIQQKEQQTLQRELREEQRQQRIEQRQQRQREHQELQTSIEPERIKIPPSPVTERRGPLSIFRKGPPSRPADEQKTEIKVAPEEKKIDKSRDAGQQRNVERGREGSRERGRK